MQKFIGDGEIDARFPFLPIVVKRLIPLKDRKVDGFTSKANFPTLVLKFSCNESKLEFSSVLLTVKLNKWTLNFTTKPH